MARILLLADSNFINNIGAYKGKKIKDLEVKSCQSRKAVMAELATVEEGIVVLACLDMVAADIAATTIEGADHAVDYYYSQILYKMSEKVDEADGKLAFGIVAPLFWTSHSVEVKRAMNHSFRTMKITPMVNIWCSEYHRDVKAGDDGTHLTSLSAAKYIKHIHDLFELVSNSSKIGAVTFVKVAAENGSGQGEAGGSGAGPAENGNQTEAMSWADEGMTDQEAVTTLAPPDEQFVIPPSRTATMLSASMMLPVRVPSLRRREEVSETQARLMCLAQPDLSMPPPRLGVQQTGQGLNDYQQPGQGFNGFGQSNIERRVGALEAQIFYNNLTTAALKEELDTEANKAMLNRVSVSGVVIDGIDKMTDTEKIPAMKAKITEIIDSIKEPEQTFEITFVRHLNKQIRGQKWSVIEVKLADEAQAKLLRAQFVKKYKTLDKINMAPVVRQSTRVRIEILHSVCFYLKRHDRSVVRASCLQFIPKPVIKVVRKSFSGTEVTRTMTFIDAVNWVKENGLLGRMDLSKAQERAGSSSRGTLAQHFVILD